MVHCQKGLEEIYLRARSRASQADEWAGVTKEQDVLCHPHLMGSALWSSPHVALLVFPIHVLPTVSKGVPCHIHLLEAEIRSRPGPWVGKKHLSAH